MTSLLSTAVLAAVPQLSYWRELAALSNKGDVNPPILAERSMFEDLGRGSCTNDARSNIIFSASLRPIDGNRADCEARCFNDTSCMAYSFGWQPQPNQAGHEHDEYWCETFSDCGSLKLAPIHPHLHEYGVRSYKRVMPTPVPTPTPTALPTVTPTGTPVVEFSDDPDDCVCCERTLAVMTRYCKTEMVRAIPLPPPATWRVRGEQKKSKEAAMFSAVYAVSSPDTNDRYTRPRRAFSVELFRKASRCF